MRSLRLTLFCSFLASCWLMEARFASAADEAVTFQDEVLPILSNRCFLCHGPDESSREADLRLDALGPATEDRGGYRAIEPGDAERSELMVRILAEDDSLVMPPAESGMPRLTPSEVEILRKWIAGGATYRKHWAFERVEQPTPPEVKHAGAVHNAIDRFVVARLEQEGLAPAPEAPRLALLRRASLALTGLPPSEEMVAEYLADTSDEAYEHAVDQLLASPHFGERLAYAWLDAARYADTDGFQHDESRTNWPWRDWVVQAINNNMPFDQFTINQFAGDLMKDRTQDQIVATCFHRNHMTNGEGGRDPEESRVDYVIDRTNTVGTTWLGLTVGCAQCHTHKYDPITQHEYYELTAFFNSIDEDGKAGRGKQGPYLKYAFQADEVDYFRDQLEPLQAAVDRARARRDQLTKAARARFSDWLASQAARMARAAESIRPTEWETLKIESLESEVRDVRLVEEGDGIVATNGAANPDNNNYRVVGGTQLRRLTAVRLEALPHRRHTLGGLARSNSGNFVLTDFEIRLQRPGKRDSLPLKIASAQADYEQPGYLASSAIDGDPMRGWAVWSGNIATRRHAVFKLAEPVELDPETRVVVRLRHESRNKQHNIGRFRLSVTADDAADVDILASGPLAVLATVKNTAELSKRQRDDLMQFFLDHDGELGVARGQLVNATEALKKAKAEAHVEVMVLRERPKPRDTFVLVRGVWDQHGDKVTADVPEVLGALPEGAPRNRLTFARWLVDRDNPLTARVTVNRYWQHLFGAGIVRTPEDFGVQGERPTHPQLLDWLAAEFMESGWDVKHLHRLIVTSATFRQSSQASAELRERDPDNRLLARGPRFRLPAPVLRDAALAASGLMVPKVGGPPTMPYQPPGVWSDGTQGKYVYRHGEGEELYRRSLYSFWRRNAAPPDMFDSSDRRICSVSTVRTNSPMHALNLLNDETYVEAARGLAERALLKEPGRPYDQIAWGFRRVLTRTPDELEQRVLLGQYEKQLARFAEQPKEADELLKVGESPVAAGVDHQELAAMTATMSVILNLDEALNLE